MILSLLIIPFVKLGMEGIPVVGVGIPVVGVDILVVGILVDMVVGIPVAS
jgi:hypothetical protein